MNYKQLEYETKHCVNCDRKIEDMEHLENMTEAGMTDNTQCMDCFLGGFVEMMRPAFDKVRKMLTEEQQETWDNQSDKRKARLTHELALESKIDFEAKV